MAPPELSVIIPAYNSSSFVVKAVENVVAQTYKDIEIIVVDDGSTDDTRQMLDGYISGSVIRYIHQDNAGAAAARNAGMRACSGAYIAFLDADDLWHEDKLEKQKSLLKDNPETVLVFCNGYNRKGDSVKPLIKEDIPGTGGSDFLDPVLLDLTILPSSIMFRKELLSETGLLDERLRYADDYDFIVKAAMAGRFGYLPEFLWTRIDHPDNLSSAGMNKATYYMALYNKYVALLDKKRLALLRRRIGRTLFMFCRKYASIGLFKETLAVYCALARISPRYAPKLPGLIVRYVRFALK